MWEYKRERNMEGTYNPYNFFLLLNNYGKEGWEIIDYREEYKSGGYDFLAIMKRKIKKKDRRFNKIKIKLESILKNKGNVKHRPNHLGTVNGDTENLWAFDLHFNEDTSESKILDTAEYWMPILEKEIKIVESFWHNRNHATIWIRKNKKIEK